jgi:GNAT superfamily N-acetyltransferase
VSVSVRALRVEDLAAADRIFRLAFGTFLGLPDPVRFAGDADYAHTRWRAKHGAAFAAEADGELAGSNFVTRWGSFGFFGPLTVRPDLWNRGVARRLLEPTMELFDRWHTTHRGLFTFAHSPKHHALYQRFGFYPRFLTALMSRAVPDEPSADGFARFSAVPVAERDAWLERCREVTGSIYPGLDVAGEILAVDEQKLGDTILLDPEDTRLSGLAVCHLGAGTEAGSGTCYVKFAAALAGPRAERSFARLLEASTALARSAGMRQILAGVNLARERAYRDLLEHGLRSLFVGVAMQSGNDPAYNRPDVFALDDWR